MKQTFKITAYSLLFIALTLGTTHAFGMNSLFEGSKGNFHTPGTLRSDSMPSATAALMPESKEGLVPTQTMDVKGETKTGEESMGESKEAIKLNHHDENEPRFQLLYDLLTTIPRELVYLILDYAKEFEGKHVRTISKGLSLIRGIITLSPHVIGAYDFETKITLFDLKTGKQLKTIEQDFIYNPIKFSKSELAFFSNRDHKIIVVNWQKDTTRTMKINGNSLDGVAKLPHGPLMTHNHLTGIIKLWNPHTEKLVKELDVAVYEYYQITPLSKRIIAIKEHPTTPPAVILWDIYTDNEITTITLNSYPEKLIPLSATILAIAFEKTIEIYNTAVPKVPKLIRTIETQDKLIDVTKFPTENIIVACIKREREMTIALYDPETGECLKNFATGLLAIPNFAKNTLICPSDRCIVARSYGLQSMKHEIKIWE